MDAACCYRCSVVRVFVCQKRAVIGALCVKNFSEGDEIMWVRESSTNSKIQGMANKLLC